MGMLERMREPNAAAADSLEAFGAATLLFLLRSVWFELFMSS